MLTSRAERKKKKRTQHSQRSGQDRPKRLSETKNLQRKRKKRINAVWRELLTPQIGLRSAAEELRILFLKPSWARKRWGRRGRGVLFDRRAECGDARRNREGPILHPGNCWPVSQWKRCTWGTCATMRLATSLALAFKTQNAWVFNVPASNGWDGLSACPRKTPHPREQNSSPHVDQSHGKTSGRFQKTAAPASVSVFSYDLAPAKFSTCVTRIL